MDNQRAAHIAEIRRIEAALDKTSSPYLKRDYGRYLAKLKRELRDYDRFKKAR